MFFRSKRERNLVIAIVLSGFSIICLEGYLLNNLKGFGPICAMGLFILAFCVLIVASAMSAIDDTERRLGK